MMLSITMASHLCRSLLIILMCICISIDIHFEGSCASPFTRPMVTASFVLGDSLADAGNNNYLQTLSRANFPHFGIDFPPAGDRPTGRYTNGFTIPDLIGIRLGIPALAPPFLAPTTTGPSILLGVNYASGGGGILNKTGRDFIGRLSLDTQISFFEQTMEDLRSMFGKQNAMYFMSKAIVSITVGANDFLNNYLLPVPMSNDSKLPQQAFVKQLITQYRRQLMRIYNAGARKLIIVAVPPIGCTPYLRTLNLQFTGQCVTASNALVSSFNDLLKELVSNISGNLPGANLVYADAYSAALDILNDYQTYGFEDITAACCGLGGPDGGLLPCQASFPVCPDRSKYFFWDAFHPTQAAYELIAHQLLNGTAYTSPMNLIQLAAL